MWLFALVTLTNDPLPPSEMRKSVSIRDGAVICVGTTVLPGAEIGMGAYIAAGCLVKGDVPPGAVVSRVAESISGSVGYLVHMESGLRHPWMRHFRRGYPPQATARLDALLEAILGSRFGQSIEENHE